MTVTFHKLHPYVGAEVSAVDLRQVHDRATLEQLRAGMDEHGVLVFRELNISDDKVCYIVLKAREFDAKVEPTEPDPGSNPTDSGEREILEDYLGAGTVRRPYRIAERCSTVVGQHAEPRQQLVGEHGLFFFERHHRNGDGYGGKAGADQSHRPGIDAQLHDVATSAPPIEPNDLLPARSPTATRAAALATSCSSPTPASRRSCVSRSVSR